MIAFLLYLAATICFLLLLFHAHVAVNLLVLGFALIALGLTLSSYPGPRA